MKLNQLNQDTLNDLPAGEHADGLGLYLIVKPTGGRSWMFKFSWANAKKKMGLGSACLITLDEARSLALDARKLVNAGTNPLTARVAKPAQRSSPPFLDYAREVAKVKSHGQKQKSVAAWERAVESYGQPLHKLEVANITRADVKACLEPIWLTIPISAATFRARLETIFDHAIANGLLPDDHKNPADWSMLKHLLPKQPPVGTARGGHKSLPYQDMPVFWNRLVKFDTTSARTLRFVILTCARTKEATQLQWDQLDLEAGRWDLPAKVMKNGLKANVPLSSDAVALLRQIKAEQDLVGFDTTKGYVFRGQNHTTMQGENTMLKLIQESLGLDVTTHGFRATFKTWAGEKTNHDRDTQEYCLHHITGEAAEQAYKRGDFWDKRQACLQDWADVVCGRKSLVPARPALALVA